MSATAMSKKLPTTALAAPIRLKRGFALFSPERLREVSSKAGKTSWANGTANKFTKASASAAGKKGGMASGLIRHAKAQARKEGATP